MERGRENKNLGTAIVSLGRDKKGNFKRPSNNADAFFVIECHSWTAGTFALASARHHLLAARRDSC